jgi:hypothetical protein
MTNYNPMGIRLIKQKQPLTVCGTRLERIKVVRPFYCFRISMKPQAEFTLGGVQVIYLNPISDTNEYWIADLQSDLIVIIVFHHLD